MIKTLIFDNNGVLTTCDNNMTIPRFAEYFGIETEKLREKFHYLVMPADLGHISTEDFFRDLCREFGKEYKPDELWPIFLSSYQPYPEMTDQLMILKEKYQLALLTNFVDSFDKINKQTWHYQNLFKSENLFISSKLNLAKPDKEFYQYALNKLGSKPEETLFIDDRELNLIPARELGINTILFLSPKQFQKELQLILGQTNS